MRLLARPRAEKQTVQLKAIVATQANKEHTTFSEAMKYRRNFAVRILSWQEVEVTMTCDNNRWLTQC